MPSNDAEALLRHIQEADAILVGAASGMSAAAGYRFYYERDALFLKWFGDFEEKYGFHNAFDGYYYRFPTREEFWAYTARFIRLVYESNAGKPYADLSALLQGRNYHVLTTNQDALFTQICPPEKLSAIQGDWRYFQCKRRCHDAIYPNKEQVYAMTEAISDCRIPSELVPRCPKCGGEMEPWVRGHEFLEGSKYQDEYRKVNEFLQENQHKKLLFLELGVGRMTPMFIQQPFWSLTWQLPQAFYITINPRDAIVPQRIAQKSLAIRQDIAAVLDAARKLC